MRSRRTETLLWLGTLAALLTITALFPFPFRTKLWGAILDSAHAPVFALVALLFLRLSRLWLEGRNHFAIAFAAVIALGLATEALQLLSARSADALDLLRNLVGGATALGFCYAGRASWPRLGVYAARAVAILAMLATFAPLLWCVHAYRLRAEAFPRLAGFDSRAERIFLEAVGARLSRADGASTVQFRADGGEYPRFAITEVEPDWRGYDELLVDVHNPGASAVRLNIRIHDQDHVLRSREDRFYREVELLPGDNHLRIALSEVERAPAGRKLDLSRVENLTFFLAHPTEHVTLRFDSVQLE